MKTNLVEATVHAAASTVPLLGDGVEGYDVTSKTKAPPRPFVAVRVETNDGITGYGFTGRFLANRVAGLLNIDIADALSGMDISDPIDTYDRLSAKLNPRHMTGAVMSALSALDIALWDIHGKASGQNISSLLGGARTAAPAYITFGMPQYDRDQLAEAASLAVAGGFTTLKMVVAVDPGGWREDAARIHAVRDAIGPDIGLVIDANEGFLFQDASALLSAVSDCALTWFEEPIEGNDPITLAAFREKTGVSVGAGQFEADPRLFAAFLDGGGVDVVQPNVCYAGGFTGASRIARLAAERGHTVANGAGWPLLNVHLMTGLENGGLIEHHIAQTGMAEAIFADPPAPVDGMFTAPTGPGLGLEINVEGLAACRLNT